MRIRLLAAALLLALAVPAQASSTTTLTGKSKGSTVTVHRGDTVQVTLSSTAWTIEAPHGPALRATGPQTTTFVAGPTCHPGQGCGTTQRTFRAVAAGTATLVATRTQCGEALQCTPATSRWQATVRVQAVHVPSPQRLPFTGAPVGLLLLLAAGLLVAGGAVTRAAR